MQPIFAGHLMSEQELNSSVVLEHPSAQDPVPLPGEQLAARRQAEGWSIEQVAAQLKLAPRQIEAIEAGRFDALPSAIIARGFVRTYARLLKMDPAPLLATISADIPSPIESMRRQRPLSTPFSETRLPSMHPRGTWSPNWTAGALLALVLGGAIWGAQQVNWHSILPEALLGAIGMGRTTTAMAPVADEAQTMVVEAPTEAPTPVTVVDAAKIDVATPIVPILVGSEGAPVQVSATPAQVTAVAPPAAVAAAAPAAVDNRLSLVLHQDSWIEIKRQDNSVLISRVAKAGTTEIFEITEPVSLVVGNVAGVEARLRDAPLDLKSVTSTNVARLNLK